MVRLIPKNQKFFDMFAEMCGNIVEGAKLLEPSRARTRTWKRGCINCTTLSTRAMI